MTAIEIKNAILNALPSNLTYAPGDSRPPTLRVNWNEDGADISYQRGGPGNAYSIPRRECYVTVGMEADRLNPGDDEEIATQFWIEKNIGFWVSEIEDAIESEDKEEEEA